MVRKPLMDLNMLKPLKKNAIHDVPFPFN